MGAVNVIKTDRVSALPDDQWLRNTAGGAGAAGGILGALGALIDSMRENKEEELPKLDKLPNVPPQDEKPPQDEEKPGAVIPTPGTDEQTPEINDKTNENLEQALNFTSLEDIYNQLKADRDEQWAREDAIRKETQAREDTAWQRSIEDARKAGINPNLMNMQPAESGGGITQATGMDYSALSAQLNKEGSILEALLNNEFKEDENTKDRINNLISSIISTISMMFVLKKNVK